MSDYNYSLYGNVTPQTFKVETDKNKISSLGIGEFYLHIGETQEINNITFKKGDSYETFFKRGDLYQKDTVYLIWITNIIGPSPKLNSIIDIKREVDSSTGKFNIDDDNNYTLSLNIPYPEIEVDFIEVDDENLQGASVSRDENKYNIELKGRVPIISEVEEGETSRVEKIDGTKNEYRLFIPSSWAMNSITTESLRGYPFTYNNKNFKSDTDKEKKTIQDLLLDIKNDGDFTKLESKSDLIVKGNTSLKGTLSTDKTSTLKGDVTVGTTEENGSAELTVNGTLTTSDKSTVNSLEVTNTSSLKGNVTIGSTEENKNANLTVNGELESGDTTVNSLEVTDTSSLKGNITVGTTEENGSAELTVNGTLTTSDKSTVNSLEVTNTSSLKGNVTVGTTEKNGSATLTVNGKLESGDTAVNSLEVANASTLKGALTVNNTSTLKSDVTIGSTEDDKNAKLTVNGELKSGDTTVKSININDNARIDKDGNAEIKSLKINNEYKLLPPLPVWKYTTDEERQISDNISYGGYIIEDKTDSYGPRFFGNIIWEDEYTKKDFLIQTKSGNGIRFEFILKNLKDYIEKGYNSLLVTVQEGQHWIRNSVPIKKTNADNKDNISFSADCRLTDFIGNNSGTDVAANGDKSVKLNDGIYSWSLDFLYNDKNTECSNKLFVVTSPKMNILTKTALTENNIFYHLRVIKIELIQDINYIIDYVS